MFAAQPSPASNGDDVPFAEGEVSSALPTHNGRSSRWIKAQQLGFGASLLALTRRPTNRQRELVFRLLSSKLRISGLLEEDAYVTHCETLPSTVLNALLSIPDDALGAWSGHKQMWERAAKNQHQKLKKLPLVASKLIADRIMSGLFTPAQIIRMARAELGKAWSKSHGATEALQTLVDFLAQADRTALQKSAAVSVWGSHAQYVSWKLVENALHRLVFSWPLLAVPLTKDSGVEFILPAGIDVYFDGAGTVRPADDAGLDMYGWLESVQLAKKAAQNLWLKNYSALPIATVKQVTDSSVVVDLSAAAEIVRPFGNWIDIQATQKPLNFPVVGRSAEALFMLSILQRYVGSTAMRTTAATGIISSYWPDRDGPGGDYAVESPNLIPLKIATASKSAIHDRIIIPLGSYTGPRYPHLIVEEARSLSEFAEAALGQNFQRHRWIRCSDLAVKFRPNRGDVAPDSQEVREVLAILRSNKGRRSWPIVELEPSLRPEAVVRALYRLNDRIGRDRNAGRFADFGRFVVMRCNSDERNERFWRVIWDAVVGSESDFFDFQFRVDAYTAGRTLAKLLDSTPDLNNSTQPRPDIIVLVGYERLFEEDAHGPLSPFSRLGLKQVLEAFGKCVQASRNYAIRDRVGHTRIILVRESDELGPWLADETNTAPDLLEHVRKLSVFRHGFTWPMARDVLGTSDEDCQNIVENLGQMRNGLRHLEYASRPRELYLTCRADLGVLPDLELAQLHDRAANSIAGFLAPIKTEARSNFTEAFKPDRLHEVQWHLSRASALRDGNDVRSRSARERLSRVAEPFGWSRLRWAVRHSNEDGDELLWALQSHLDERDERGYFLPHPHELCLAARFAFKMAQRHADQGSVAVRTMPTKLTWKRLLSQAEVASTVLKLSEVERRAAIIETRLLRATMKVSEEPDVADTHSFRSKIDFLARQMMADPTVASDEAFEWLGDLYDERQTGVAIDIYERGLKDVIDPATGLPRINLLIKYFGACGTAKVFGERWIADVIRQHVEEFSTLVIPARSGYLRSQYVEDRWRMGVVIFGGIIRAALRQLDYHSEQSV